MCVCVCVCVCVCWGGGGVADAEAEMCVCVWQMQRRVCVTVGMCLGEGRRRDGRRGAVSGGYCHLWPRSDALLNAGSRPTAWSELIKG